MTVATLPREQLVPRAQQYTGLDRKKTVVLFAGSGGSCMGIEEAYCAGGLDQGVDLAVNHCRDAIACHMANHPLTEHLQCDVFEVDPETVQGPIGLLWGSPDCTDFSKAKGGKPIRTVKRRSLAWVLIHWAFVKQPDVIMLENVEEFEQWGPLDRHGMPVRDGSTFLIWVNCLRYLGYQVQSRQLRACDYGTPTTRNRLFVVARRDGKPIIWPEATHGRHEPFEHSTSPSCTEAVQGIGRLPRSSPEGFARSGQSGLRGVHRADQRNRRVRASIDDLGQRSEFRHCLKPYVPAAACIDFDLPMCSIFATAAEAAQWGQAHKLPRPKRPIVRNTCSRIARGIRRYVIDAASPFIVRTGHYSNITGEGDHFRGQGIEQPLGTVTAGYHDKALVEAQLAPLQVGAGGSAYAGKPRTVDRPHGTVKTDSRAALVAAVLARTGNTNAQGSYTNDAGEPLRTITTCHDQQLVGATLVGAAHLTHMYSSNVAGGQGDLSKPKTTVLAGGNHAGLLAALLAPYYGSGSGREGRDVRQPIATIPATERHQLITAALEQREAGELPAGFWRVWWFLIEHLGEDAPAPILVVDGEVYLITDILMRMLTPRELARCQGFRDDYVIDRGADGRHLSKRVQVRLIGNSVCRQVARALVEANVVDLDVMWRASA